MIDKTFVKELLFVYHEKTSLFKKSPQAIFLVKLIWSPQQHQDIIKKKLKEKGYVQKAIVATGGSRFMYSDFLKRPKKSYFLNSFIVKKILLSIFIKSKKFSV